MIQPGYRVSITRKIPGDRPEQVFCPTLKEAEASVARAKLKPGDKAEIFEAKELFVKTITETDGFGPYKSAIKDDPFGIRSQYRASQYRVVMGEMAAQQQQIVARLQQIQQQMENLEQERRELQATRTVLAANIEGLRPLCEAEIEAPDPSAARSAARQQP